MVIAIYGPNQSGRRANLWSEILRVRSWRLGTWVIGGDFNVVRFSDVRKGEDLNVQYRGQFNELIANLGLIEIPMTKYRYTCFSMREEPSMVKLDSVFVSSKWEIKFSLATAHPMRKSTSNHVPIKLDSGEVREKEQNIFSSLKSGGSSMRRYTKSLGKAGCNKQIRKMQLITFVLNFVNCAESS